MNNLLTLPSLLSPSPVSPSREIVPEPSCGPLEANCDVDAPAQVGRTWRALAAATGFVRLMARNIRHESSLSHKAITETGVNDLLRRH